MTNKDVIKDVINRVKDNIFRGSSYAYFKGNRPPGKNQVKILDKHRIPIDVDPEIRKVVIELNENGIRTLGSCAGHRMGEQRGFVTIAHTVEEINVPLLKKIFSKSGIDTVEFDTTKWVDWFSVQFESIGKDIETLKKI